MIQSFRDGDSFAAALQARTQPPHSRAHTLERPVAARRARRRARAAGRRPASPGGLWEDDAAGSRRCAAGVRRASACAWLTLDAAEHTPGRLARSLGAALFAAGERDGRAWPRDLLDGDEETAGARLMRALQRRDERRRAVARRRASCGRRGFRRRTGAPVTHAAAACALLALGPPAPARPAVGPARARSAGGDERRRSAVFPGGDRYFC